MIQRFETFAITITELYKSLVKIKTQCMSGYHLKGSHVMCLFYLEKSAEPLTVTELSSLCHEDKAATSRSIGELENLGYVIFDSDTKYRAPIALTAAGQKIALDFKTQIENAVTAGGCGITDEERDTFYRCLAIISRNLKEYTNSYEGESHT